MTCPPSSEAAVSSTLWWCEADSTSVWSSLTGAKWANSSSTLQWSSSAKHATVSIKHKTHTQLSDTQPTPDLKTAQHEGTFILLLTSVVWLKSQVFYATQGSNKHSDCKVLTTKHTQSKSQFLYSITLCSSSPPWLSSSSCTSRTFVSVVPLLYN